VVEPWLRGTLTEYEAVPRQIVHALELAVEDIERWCSGLTDAEMEARPFGIAPTGFHLRHIARSLDRLLSYAEGDQLSTDQLAALSTELIAPANAAATMAEVREGISSAMDRVKVCGLATYDEPRFVGRKRLPTTVGGLLVHCADHTQRHVGQAVTTAKVVVGLREERGSGTPLAQLGDNVGFANADTLP
jgi:DinB superfamily